MSLKNLPEPQKSGLLLLDKPADFSSHDIIAICRRILKTKKIGHSGTLDPMATGLLIVLVGREATKRQDAFLKLPKTYSAVLKLGTETDSWDAHGDVTTTAPVPDFSPEDLRRATQKLSGTITQPIPFFSAKKIGGYHMYELARKGREIERRHNKVTVAWRQVTQTADDEITFTVHCSCGTYVRSLGYLLAKELGTGGHLTALRRLEIGPFSVQNAFDGNLLKGCPTDTLYAQVEPIAL